MNMLMRSVLVVLLIGLTASCTRSEVKETVLPTGHVVELEDGRLIAEHRGECGGVEDWLVPSDCMVRLPPGLPEVMACRCGSGML